MQTQANTPHDWDVTEKPQNGIAGLKHWRSDMLAGLMVSLVSLPFSLGIAIASGAPPIAGLVSAIIAGAIYPFLGGSYVTISGPAAGLAPAIFVAMSALGGGSDEQHRAVGYPLLLGVICMVGVVQIILSRLKVARFSAWFSPTVVEAMLASIGLLIIAKQVPNLIGRKFEAHEFWEIVLEIPRQVMQMDRTNVTVFVVGGLCLALTIILSASKSRFAKIIPPPLTVVLFGLVLGKVFSIGGKNLIEIPANVLEHGIVLPNFRGLFADHTLWWTAFTTVLTLTLIDGVESLATIAGIDKIDPYKRKSSPDRTLTAMGISNILSSLAGGLTIIPGGVKSTTCIVTGGKTLWANFYNAVFLVMYLFLAKDLINLIPLSALSAIVVFIGYKLCKPKVWRHVAHIGSEQLLVFCATVLVTVSTDLLIGIFAGMVLEFVLNVSLAWPAARAVLAAPRGTSAMAGTRPPGDAGLIARFTDLFRNPVTNRELVDNHYHVYFGRPLVAFNSLYVNRELTRIPEQATTVHFHLSDEVTLIDHTSSANLMGFARDYAQSGKGEVQFTGLEEMFKCSNDATCTRLGDLALADATTGGGLRALATKFKRSLFKGPRAAPEAVSAKTNPAAEPRRFASAADDSRWLSLSSSSAQQRKDEDDVSRLGPAADADDANSELDRISLTWDGTKRMPQ